MGIIKYGCKVLKNMIIYASLTYSAIQIGGFALRLKDNLMNYDSIETVLSGTEQEPLDLDSLTNKEVKRYDLWHSEKE